MSDSLGPHGLYSPGNSPGLNTKVDSHSLLQGDLPNPGIETRSPALQADSLPAEPPGKPKNTGVGSLSLLQQIFPTQESNLGLHYSKYKANTKEGRMKKQRQSPDIQWLEQPSLWTAVKVRGSRPLLLNLVGLWVFCYLISRAPVLNHFSCVQLFATLWTIACQAPLSLEFSRPEYWSGLPCPSPGNLPNPGIKPVSLTSTCIGKQVLYH